MRRASALHLALFGRAVRQFGFRRYTPEGGTGYETETSDRTKAPGGPRWAALQATRAAGDPAGPAAGAGAAALGAAGLWLRHLGGPGGEAPAAPDAGTPPAGEWRAAWISYIELQGMDYTSAEAFRAGAAAMMDRCAGLGLNTVIVQVRPFGDALYPSALFPWSHICTGVQGVSPGFDRWTSC